MRPEQPTDEARLNALLSRSRDVVAVLDPDGTLTYISPSAPQLFGYPYGSHLGAKVFDLVHPDDRDRALEAMTARLETTADRDPLELRVAHADGTWHDLELVSTNLVDDPLVRGVVLNIRDITERRRSERVLRDSEKQRDTLLTNSSDVIVVTDANGTARYVSPAVERIFGYEPDTWIGRSVLELVHPGDVDQAMESLGNTAQSAGQKVALELRVVDAAGEWRHVEVVANNLLADPVVEGIVFNVRDVTERVEHIADLHRTQLELTSTSRLFEAVLSNLSDLVSVMDANGTMIYVSPVTDRMFGRRAEDRQGKSIFEFVHPDDRDRVLSGFRMGLKKPGLSKPVVMRVQHEDGTYRTLEVSTNNLVHDRTVNGVIVTSRDITERVEAERQQRERDEHFRTIVDIANEGIWTIDVENVTTFVNPRMAEMLGYSVDEMIGVELFTFLDEEGRRITEDNLRRRRAGVREHFDFKFVRADGEPLWAMISTSPLLDDDGAYAGALALVTDVTERRHAETALRDAELQRQRDEVELERRRLEVALERARRVETIGQLAAGVAHDFNNLLGVISNYATLSVKHLPDGPTRDDVLRILEAAQHGSQLTRRLLLIGQRDQAPFEVVLLDEAITRSVEFLRPALGDTLQISVATHAAGAKVALSAGGLEQILLNALLNARDALPHGGRVDVRTAVDGADAVIEIRDDGVGMDEDIAQRAAEPFFSTKSPDQGSGLGLSTIKSTAERAGGSLRLNSSAGRGTQVVVRVPLSREPFRE